MTGDMVLILDFGGISATSVARKVRGERVYCEILPHDVPAEVIRERNPKGILLVGGPEDAYLENSPTVSAAVFAMDVPVLGIGYGARALARMLGAKLVDSLLDRHTQQVDCEDSPLFSDLGRIDRYFERVDVLDYPDNFEILARGTDGVPVAFSIAQRRLYGMQFYAEQNDPDGLKILNNFIVKICGCAQWWEMETFISKQIEEIRQQVGDGSALLTVSGGIDSTVAAVLMHRAIGRRMHCLHVDTGLMRKGETRLVQDVFADRFGMDLIRVDASERFLHGLRGIHDPAEKHRIVARELVESFVDAAAAIERVDCLVQGTIYSDILGGKDVEEPTSISEQMNKRLGERIHLEKLIEPVRMLFKEEVRQVGEILGLPTELVHRQPFPVTGLANRCLGEVTAYKLKLLRESDAIFQEEIVLAGLDKRIWQSFVVLTDIRSNSMREELNAYEYTIALRAVNQIGTGEITAYRLSYDVLERVVERVSAEVPGINRVVYDITGKPPASVEWE